MRIEENLFLENSSGGNGGAIAISGGMNLVLNKNVFKGNSTASGDGGAVWILNTGSGGRGGATIRYNQFWENEAYDHGGAMEISIDHTQITIDHNLFVHNKANGLDTTLNWGTGGAISMRPAYGTVRFNTFVDNRGSDVKSGGSILIQHALSQTLDIRNNIISGSEHYAIRCVSRRSGILDPGIAVEDNLFWMSSPDDIDDSDSCIPNEWMDFNLFDDPLFCGADADSFTVSKDSPALNNGTPIGAFWNPGCGPGVPCGRNHLG